MNICEYCGCEFAPRFSKKYCNKHYRKLQHIKNKEKDNALCRKYYNENKEERNKKSSEYYFANLEELTKYHKEYRDNHKEEMAAYNQEYYKENKEDLLFSANLYYKNNVEKVLLQKREYYKNNKKEIRERLNYRYKNDPEYRLKQKLRNGFYDRHYLYLKNTDNCKYKYKGVDFKKIYEYLGEPPYEEFEVDHIIPMCVFDFTKKEHVSLCYSPENFRYITKEENRNKSDYIFWGLISNNEVLLKICEVIGLTSNYDGVRGRKFRKEKYVNLIDEDEFEKSLFPSITFDETNIDDLEKLCNLIK